MWRASWKYAKLILPHGRFRLVPPHFAFPLSYGYDMPNFTIPIGSAGFANFWLLFKQANYP